MKACIQRVTRAEVRVDGERVSAIGRGMVCLLGILEGDDEERAERLARRVAQLRMFEDERDKMRHPACEVGAECLVVSQITLAWEGATGHRPSFERAAGADAAQTLYAAFKSALEAQGVLVREGVFGAKMDVELVNSGPVTFLLEEGLAP